MPPKSKSPLQSLQDAFGKGTSTDCWTPFVTKMANWEKDLVLADFNVIDSKLVACGIDPLKTPAMANALLGYFNPADTSGGPPHKKAKLSHP